MAGGALSNFLERFFLGHVIDWIPSPIFFAINFNLADVEISLGALIAFLAIMSKTEEPEGQKEAATLFPRSN